MFRLNLNTKPLALAFVTAGISLSNLSFADDAPTIDGVTKEQAQAMAEKYKAIAAHYEEIAAKFDQSQDDKNKESDSNSDTKDSQATSDSKETIKEKMENPEKSPWDGTNASLGFQYNTGNTFTRNLAAATSISYKASEKWLNTLTANYQNNFDYNKDQTTANKFYSSGQTEYDFNKYNGVYLNVQYLNDQLSGYVYQTNENVGYKRLIFKNDSMNLNLFVGPGLQQTRQTEDTGGAFQNEPSIQVKTQYNWNINDKTTYQQTLQWLKTPINYQVGLTMSLSTSIYNSLGLQPSFTLNYNSNPPVDKNGNQKKKLDTVTQLSLVYNF